MLVLMLLLFGALALAAFALFSALDQRQQQARLLHERLSAVERAAHRQPSEELALLRDELVSAIPALNRMLSRSKGISRLQNWLLQAEIKIRPAKFLMIALWAGALPALIVDYLLRNLLFVPLAFVAGALIPFAYAAILRQRRFRKFEAKFPETIEILARAVRAGHAFTTALELISSEMAEPIAGEFRKVFEEQKFGLPLRDALLNLTERVPLVDVKFFVTAVLLQRETGGNLAEILDKLSYLIRERFKILRQVRVYTAQGRLTMAILMALPPGLVVMFMLTSPDFIKPLYTDPAGHMLIAVGVVMQTIGFLLIRKIIHIQV